ncbi:hypothetical protein RR42_m3070 [Cupriavidus basilensis]|uniref:Uncharacterized protein n=1 Tax=Cupriavidus basilensis TaxID=68895 RepID=A0A0C4YC46_9BURK|nr:hypothetical protein RR42_m3070 [Cupriavidus basilensis]
MITSDSAGQAGRGNAPGKRQIIGEAGGGCAISALARASGVILPMLCAA